MAASTPQSVNSKRLQQLYRDNAAARHVLDHFASRERNWSTTTVDRILANVLSDGAQVSRADVIFVFKELEVCGCGIFRTGRKGFLSRFEWTVGMVSVGQAAAGEIDRVEAIAEEETGEEEGSMFQHAFRLRRDFTAKFELPADLTLAEATRLAEFIKTLPL